MDEINNRNLRGNGLQANQHAHRQPVGNEMGRVAGGLGRQVLADAPMPQGPVARLPESLSEAVHVILSTSFSPLVDKLAAVDVFGSELAPPYSALASLRRQAGPREGSHVITPEGVRAAIRGIVVGSESRILPSHEVTEKQTTREFLTYVVDRQILNVARTIFFNGALDVDVLHITARKAIALLTVLNRSDVPDSIVTYTGLNLQQLAQIRTVFHRVVETLDRNDPLAQQALTWRAHLDQKIAYVNLDLAAPDMSQGFQFGRFMADGDAVMAAASRMNGLSVDFGVLETPEVLHNHKLAEKRLARHFLGHLVDRQIQPLVTRIINRNAVDGEALRTTASTAMEFLATLFDSDPDARIGFYTGLSPQKLTAMVIFFQGVVGRLGENEPLRVHAEVWLTHLSQKSQNIAAVLNSEELPEQYVEEYLNRNGDKDGDVLMTVFSKEDWALRLNTFIYDHWDDFPDWQLPMPSDRDFVLRLFHEAGWVLRFCQQNFSNDREAVLAAIESDMYSADPDNLMGAETDFPIYYASAELSMDRDLALASVRKDGLSLAVLHPLLRDDLKVFVVAVRQNRDAFEYGSDRVKMRLRQMLNQIP